MEIHRRAVKINNFSNIDQSIKIGQGLLYPIKIKSKRGAKNFEREMTSFCLSYVMPRYAIGQKFHIK